MSTYIDVRLRAEDEATLTAAMEPLLLTGHGIALDVIGPLYDDEGEPLPGWHANLRIAEGHSDAAAIEAALAAFVVVPANPRRVWSS